MFDAEASHAIGAANLNAGTECRCGSGTVLRSLLRDKRSDLSGVDSKKGHVAPRQGQTLHARVLRSLRSPETPKSFAQAVDLKLRSARSYDLPIGPTGNPMHKTAFQSGP